MSFFLRCPECAHHNPVTSEYLTFCENCKKKLSNNYRDWSKQHSDASFEDYKNQVCETGEQLEKLSSRDNKQKKDGWKHWINISVTLSIIFGIGVFIMPVFLQDSDLIHLFSNDQSKGSSSNFKWQRIDFADFGWSIESPVHLSPIDVPIPTSQIDVIARIGGMSAPLTAEFGLVVVNTAFVSGVQQISLQAMATASLQHLKSMPGIQDFHVNQNEIELDGIPGYKQTGTFNGRGIQNEFTAVGLSDGQMLWQVIIVYPGNTPDYQQAATRIIESIQISYNRGV